MSQKFDSMSKMAQVAIPVLVVHGAADRFVPSRFSQQLYDAATSPKTLLLVEAGSHNSSMRTGSDPYRKALGQLFVLRMRGAEDPRRNRWSCPRRCHRRSTTWSRRRRAWERYPRPKEPPDGWSCRSPRRGL